MLEQTLGFSLKHRYLVVVFVLLLATWGIFSLQKLPIDAVPDLSLIHI